MKKILSMVFVATVLFGTSSCGLYTRYTRPTDIVPTAESVYRDAAMALSDTAQNMGVMPWKELFKDPYLQVLIDSALSRNTDMRIAHLRVNQAEESLRAAKLAYIPSLSFTPNVAYSSFKLQPGAYAYSVPVNMSWQLDIFGKLTNAKRRAQAALEGSMAYRRAVQAQLIAGVANAYYTLLMLDANLDIAEQTADSWGKNVETMRLLKDAGMGNEAGVSQTEANYYAICTMVNDLRQQIFLVENSLSIMLADVPHAIERGSIYNQEFPEEYYTGIPVQLLSNRPDVAYAETQLMQAHYATCEARASMYPNITLGGSAGWTNTVGSAIINPGNLLLSAVGSLVQPIFQNGALRARLNISKAEQEVAALSFRQTVLNAGNEVNTALEQCQTSRLNRQLLENQCLSLETAVSSTQDLMQYGSATYLEVLYAQQALLNAQLVLSENRFQEIQGVINLYLSLGGGSE